MIQADRVHNTPPTNTSATLAEVAHELFEIEEKFLTARNLAYAARMLASSDDMDGESGGDLDALATTLVDLLDELADDRTRMCDLASGKEGGEHAEG
jgi:hypothetical protein